MGIDPATDNRLISSAIVQARNNLWGRYPANTELPSSVVMRDEILHQLGAIYQEKSPSTQEIETILRRNLI
jgi:hypothetical protein